MARCEVIGGMPVKLCEGPLGWPLCEWSTCVWGALDGRSTVGGCARNACVREAQGCASRGWGQCDDVIVTTDAYVIWLPCHRSWFFGIAVRVHVWHPVDPGSSPGGVTTQALRCNICPLLGTSITQYFRSDGNTFGSTKTLKLHYAGILQSIVFHRQVIFPNILLIIFIFVLMWLYMHVLYVYGQIHPFIITSD